MLMIYIGFMFTYVSIFIYGIGIFVIFAIIAVIAASSDLIMRAAMGRGFIW